MDAAILVAAVRGRTSAAIVDVATAVSLVTTDRAVEEASRRIALGMQMPELLPILREFLTDVVICPVAELQADIPAAQQSLREATTSRNGSIADAHLLALAWDADADIWSTDRDFCGTGTPVWSTPNLIRALVAHAMI